MDSWDEAVEEQVSLLQRSVEAGRDMPEKPEITSALRPIMGKIVRQQPMSAQERALYTDFKLR
jgi:hypothetical protein